jgi:hypothetical protein
MSDVNITEADRAKAKIALNACSLTAFRIAIAGRAPSQADIEQSQVNVIASALATARAEGRAEAKAPPGCIVDEQGEVKYILHKNDRLAHDRVEYVTTSLAEMERRQAAKEASDGR